MRRTNLFFVRHGQTDYNAQHVIQGQCDRSNVPGVRDIGLNETGQNQARQLAAFFQSNGVHFDLILSSDLRRAMETGEILAEALDLSLVPCPGLREMFFGADLEGTPVEALKKTRFDPPLIFADPTTGKNFLVLDGETLRGYHKSTDDKYQNVAHPGGESKKQVADRAIAALHAFVLGSPTCQNILIPTHNGLLRFIMPSLGMVDHVECIHAVYDKELKTLAPVGRMKGT